MSFGSLVKAGAQVGSAIIGYAGSRSAARDARAAAERSADIQDRQLDINEAILEDMARGGEDLRAVYEAALSSMGNDGYYSPSAMSSLQNRIASARRSERRQDKAEYDDLYRVLDPNMAADALLSSSRGSSGAYDPLAHVAPTQFYRNEFGQLVDASSGQVVNASGSSVNNALAFANEQTPEFTDGQYDDFINSMAGQYLDSFQANTDREIDALYSNRYADVLERGLGDSSFDAIMRAETADLASRRRDEDVLRAMEAAITTAGQRQGLDLQRFGAETQGTSTLLSALQALPATEAQAISNYIQSRNEGRAQTAFDYENALAYQQGVRTLAQQDMVGQQATSDNAFRTASNVLGLRGQTLGNEISQRDAALSEIAKLEALLDNYMLQDFQGAAGMMSTQQGLRGGTLDELTGVVTRPVELAAGGTQIANQGFKTAGALADSSFRSLNDRAASAAKGFGTAFNRAAEGVGTLADYDWSNIFQSTQPTSRQVNDMIALQQLNPRGGV